MPVIEAHASLPSKDIVSATETHFRRSVSTSAPTPVSTPTSTRYGRDAGLQKLAREGHVVLTTNALMDWVWSDEAWSGGRREVMALIRNATRVEASLHWWVRGKPGCFMVGVRS